MENEDKNPMFRPWIEEAPWIKEAIEEAICGQCDFPAENAAAAAESLTLAAAETKKIVYDLKSGPGTFFLGGSRRMSAKYPDHVRVSRDTDWDLYCADTPEHHNILMDMGFEATGLQYTDTQLVRIYKHPTYRIEVLVRKDVVLYAKVFEAIPAAKYVVDLWKSSPLRDKNVTDQEFRKKVNAFFNEALEAQRLADKREQRTLLRGV